MAERGQERIVEKLNARCACLRELIHYNRFMCTHAIFVCARNNLLFYSYLFLLLLFLAAVGRSRKTNEVEREGETWPNIRKRHVVHALNDKLTAAAAVARCHIRRHINM